MKRTTLAKTIIGLATAIALTLPIASAHAGNGFQIQIGPDGLNIGIDQRHRHNDSDRRDDYRGPAPRITITVNEWVRVRDVDRYGRSGWVDKNVTRVTEAYWDANRQCYWYYDSEGRQTIYRGNY